MDRPTTLLECHHQVAFTLHKYVGDKVDPALLENITCGITGVITQAYMLGLREGMDIGPPK